MLVRRQAAARPGRFVGILLALLVAVPSAHAAFTESAVPFGIFDGDSMSYAGGFIDYDGDGDIDLFTNNHWKGPAGLWRNDGAPPLVDKSAFYGTGNSDRHDTIWADFDEDGDPDHFIAHSRIQTNELFWNDGLGSFVEGAVAAGVGELEGRGREATVADFNGDQLLDIFMVCAYRAGFPLPNRLYLNNGDGTFYSHPQSGVLYEARLHTSSADYDLDGDFEIVNTSESFQPGEFLTPNGDSTWSDITSTAFPGISNPLHLAHGLSWADYDDDGWLDLLAIGGNQAIWDYSGLEADSVRYYAIADTNQTKIVHVVTDGDSVTVDAVRDDWVPLTLWYGGAGATATAFPLTLGLDQLDGIPPALSQSTQGVYLWRTVGAADSLRFVIGGAGGKAAIGVGGMLRPNGSGVLATSNQYFTSPPPLKFDNWSNRLYRNQGDGTFVEVTSTAFPVNGTSMNSHCSAWGDYDNDGDIDLYVTNGGTVETKNQVNYLYRNNGDGTFTEVAAAEGVQGSTRGMSDGAAWGDVNGDGFLDLYVTNGAELPPFGVGPRELFLNTPNGNHWARFQLRGLQSNSSAIGARVRVVTPAGVQWRTVLGETDNGYSNDPALHFGLGAHSVIDTVQVFWPSGRIDIHEQVAGDKGYWTIEQKPLRSFINPHLICLTPTLSDSLVAGQTAQHSVTLDNFGGLASQYTVVYEDCSGQPISWLALDEPASSVFPGGTDPANLVVDATALAAGSYCGRVVFQSNSFQGPDTLQVNLVVTESVVGVGVGGLLPDRFELGLPQPNPARGRATVDLALPAPAAAEVAVFDVSGRRVATVAKRTLAAGRHRLEWDLRDDAGRRVSPGLYLVRAQAGRDVGVRKIAVVN